MAAIGIKSLRPHVKLLRCDGERKSIYPKDTGIYNRCKRNATIKMGSAYFCKSHAGEHALDILMEMEKHESN